MKKIITFLMMFVMLFALTACGENNEGMVNDNNDNTQKKEVLITENPIESSENVDSNATKSNSKALVVYFSATGNTKAVAEKIAEKTNSDIFEITPEQPYTDEDLNYSNDNCRANKEMNDENARPAISSKIDNIDDYDKIYLGYPIWWGNCPKIIYTLLESYDLSGKTIIPFCTSASSSISTSVNNIKKLTNADVKEGKRFDGSATTAEIESWLKNY